MKIRTLIIALTASLIAPAAFGQTADVVSVVDESGSMGGEHAWLPGMITALDGGLNTAGVSAQYGITGYGGHVAGQVPHTHTNADNSEWFNAAGYGVVAGGLVTSGGTEDGWRAINYALTNYTYRAGAATNVILVTDEDRDNTSGDTYASTLAALGNANALLNAVVNAGFRCGDGVTRALGMDSAGNGYVADGAGGFTTCTGASAYFGSGSTVADYVDLALATGGAAWDLNLLRAGGSTATSFTNAFVAIKVKEIGDQTTTTVPEPGTLALLGLGLFGLGISRRRRTN